MLDDLRVDVRLRTPWEAADLGLVLLRSQARTVFPMVALLVLPPAFLLACGLRGLPWLPPLLLWWLKPLLDRPVLHVLARATFGEAPGIRDTLRQAPRYLRRGVLAQLLWRRVDLERSLLLPVWQLEDPGGRAFRARRRVLTRRGRAEAQMLTLVFLLFQLLAWIMGVALLAYLWPVGDTRILDAVFGKGTERIPLLDAFLWMLPSLAMVLLEPFYVAAGFGLYLNRRVQLEGWDLELAFRRLAARAGGACLLAILLLTPARLTAAPRAGEAVQEVLKAPEFATTREEWVLRPREDPTPAGKPKPVSPWLLRLPGIAGSLLKWVIPALLLGALAVFLRRKHRTLLAAMGRLDPLPAPDHLFGLDIRPQALPRDLPRAAQELWDGGDPRGALSLLYRGALAHLAHHLRVGLGPGATEGDCLERGREALPPDAFRFFSRLTGAWRGLAYGGREALPEHRELCAEWARHFGEGRP